MNRAADLPASSSQASAGRARVLVVDDNAVNRLKMSKAVEALGHRTVRAVNGVEALATIAGGEVDLVLLDIVMPEMDGFEVLRRLHADEALRHVPVIVVSSLEDMSDVTRAIELGAVDFLPKNFDATLLKARIRACLEKLSGCRAAPDRCRHGPGLRRA